MTWVLWLITVETHLAARHGDGTLVTPVLARLRQEDHRFAASLIYLMRPSVTVRPCFKIKNRQPGMVVHTCNSSIWETETGGSEFTASLSYLMRPSAT